VTESAQALEDVTRWVGVAMAILGALLANPAATQHGAGVVRQRLAATGRAASVVAARFISAFRRPATVNPRTVEGSAMMAGEASMVARGFVGWAPDATADQKIEILSERTKALNKEVGDLFALVSKTKDDLSTRLADEIGRLTREASDIRAHVDDLQTEAVRTDATALPLIVVGVVLADLSSDADRVQLWAWLLFLLLSLALAGWSTVRLVRAWPTQA